MTKIMKGLDSRNTKLAAQDKDLLVLRHEMEKLRPKKKKKIAFDANERFAKVPDVWKAREAMLKMLDPKGTSNKCQKVGFEDMCFEWQIDLPTGEK